MRKRFYGIEARGVSTLSGDKWIRVTDGNKRAYIRRSECSTMAVLRERLAQQDILVVSSDKAARLADEIDSISDYDEESLVDHSGWNANHFALPDGTVFSPTGEPKPVVVFSADDNKCAVAGTLKDWKRDVLRPLAGQPIPMFAVLLAFMPPILRFSDRTGNFGFELVGAPGIGKSTVQLLASSALGGIGRGDDGGVYCTTFNATLNALEEQMAAHSDLPMFIEEANLFLADETASKRAATFKAFAFRIGGGKGKSRLGAPPDRTHRLSYLSSSNESLASLIGENSDVSRAAADRLITLQIPADNSFGVFDEVPDGFKSASRLAAKLMDAAAANHGRGIRRFLKHLVQNHADDPAGLKARIRRLINKFTTKTGVDPNNGSAMRVAEAFGLVYAAGVLAQQFGAVPAKWKCGAAVLKCYKKYRVPPAVQVTFPEMIARLVKANGAVHLEKKNKVGSDVIEAAEIIVRETNGARELLVLASAIEKHLPGWNTLRRRPDVQVMLRSDGDHDSVKVKVHKSLKPKRFYAFVFPPVSCV